MAFFTTRTQRPVVFTSLTRAVFSRHAVARVVEDVQQPSSIHSSHPNCLFVTAYINSSDSISSTRRWEDWPLESMQQNLLTSVGPIFAFALDKWTVRACHLSHHLNAEPYVGMKSVHPWRQPV